MRVLKTAYNAPARMNPMNRPMLLEASAESPQPNHRNR
jgi:hypothetical protein